MRLLNAPLSILVLASLLGRHGSAGSPPLEEGCLTPTSPTFTAHFASFPAFQDSVTMDYCLASLHPSTLYEIHVSVPAWSPVTTSVSLVWRPLSPGEEGRGAPPGGRGRNVGAAANHSAPGPTRLLAKSGDEKLTVHGSALAAGGGTLHAVVEFHKRGSTLVLQTGVPYNIRLDPLLWGWAPQVIVQGLALPLLSSLAVTIAALVGTALLR
jgi:hypothetical protein